MVGGQQEGAFGSRDWIRGEHEAKTNLWAGRVKGKERESTQEMKMSGLVRGLVWEGAWRESGADLLRQGMLKSVTNSYRFLFFLSLVEVN